MVGLWKTRKSSERISSEVTSSNRPSYHNSLSSATAPDSAKSPLTRTLVSITALTGFPFSLVFTPDSRNRLIHDLFNLCCRIAFSAFSQPLSNPSHPGAPFVRAFRSYRFLYFAFYNHGIDQYLYRLPFAVPHVFNLLEHREKLQVF